jgi:hypothetical protein
MRLVHEDYDEKKTKMIEIIKSKLRKEEKFSMTVDEYTTLRGRRFFGVNLHGSGVKSTLKTEYLFEKQEKTEKQLLTAVFWKIENRNSCFLKTLFLKNPSGDGCRKFTLIIRLNC